MEVVERDHLVGVDEPTRERRADEAGAARDQDPLAAQSHAASLATYPCPGCDGVADVDSSIPLLVVVLRAFPRDRLRRTDRAEDRVPGGCRLEAARPHAPLRREVDRNGRVSPATACARLQRLGPAAFRPTPPNAACTEIYGGPSTARITGTFFGSPLWVRLSRSNGCEIARWQRVAFLLPRPAAP